MMSVLEIIISVIETHFYYKILLTAVGYYQVLQLYMICREM